MSPNSLAVICLLPGLLLGCGKTSSPPTQTPSQSILNGEFHVKPLLADYYGLEKNPPVGMEVRIKKTFEHGGGGCGPGSLALLPLLPLIPLGLLDDTATVTITRKSDSLVMETAVFTLDPERFDWGARADLDEAGRVTGRSTYKIIHSDTRHPRLLDKEIRYKASENPSNGPDRYFKPGDWIDLVSEYRKLLDDGGERLPILKEAYDLTPRRAHELLLPDESENVLAELATAIMVASADGKSYLRGKIKPGISPEFASAIVEAIIEDMREIPMWPPHIKTSHFASWSQDLLWLIPIIDESTYVKFVACFEFMFENRPDPFRILKTDTPDIRFVCLRAHSGDPLGKEDLAVLRTHFSVAKESAGKVFRLALSAAIEPESLILKNDVVRYLLDESPDGLPLNRGIELTDILGEWNGFVEDAFRSGVKSDVSFGRAMIALPDGNAATRPVYFKVLTDRFARDTSARVHLPRILRHVSYRSSNEESGAEIRRLFRIALISGIESAEIYHENILAKLPPLMLEDEAFRAEVWPHLMKHAEEHGGCPLSVALLYRCGADPAIRDKVGEALHKASEGAAQQESKDAFTAAVALFGRQVDNETLTAILERRYESSEAKPPKDRRESFFAPQDLNQLDGEGTAASVPNLIFFHWANAGMSPKEIEQRRDAAKERAAHRARK